MVQCTIDLDLTTRQHFFSAAVGVFPPALLGTCHPVSKFSGERVDAVVLRAWRTVEEVEGAVLEHAVEALLLPPV